MAIDLDIEKDIEEAEEEEDEESQEAEEEEDSKMADEQPVKRPGRPAKKNAHKAEMEKERQKSILQNSKSKHPFIFALYEEK